MLKLNLLIFIGFYFYFPEVLVANKTESGLSTTIEDHPFMISVQKLDTHICNGALIGRSCALTSHNCIDGININDLFVRLGSSVWRNGSLYVVMRVVTSLANGNETLQADYAILFLDVPIVESRTTRPIPLSLKSPAEVRFGAIVGWGKFRLNERRTSDVLRMAHARTSTMQRCQFLNKTLPEGTFCSKNVIRICDWDLGSVLVARGYVLGILSGKGDCDKNGQENVFTDISFHKNVIESIVNPPEHSMFEKKIKSL